jgi:hypothetical protein
MSNNCDVKLRAVMPGASWNGQWRDNVGKPVLTDAYGVPIKGGVMIDPELQELQPDPFHAPVKHLKLRVDLAGTKPYEVLALLAGINGTSSDFVTLMEAAVLPDGIKCTEALRDAMYAASFAPESWKVHEREFVSTDGCLVANGKTLANFDVLICGETVNEFGEKAYILRKSTGERVSVDAVEMPMGGWAWRFGGNCTIYDGIELFMHLTRQYAQMTDFQKREYELEPLRKKQEEIRKELDRKSRIKFPGLSNDHLDR